MSTNQRTCKACGEKKPLTEFVRSYKKDRTPDMPTYYIYRCRECERERDRSRVRDRTEYYKKRDQSPKRKRYKKEKYANLSAEERRRIAEEQKYRKYGLTKKQFTEMLEEQKGACAICGRIPSARERALAVDHDHDTGQVRRLLCLKCNVGLGYFNHDISLLKTAQAYLKKFK